MTIDAKTARPNRITQYNFFTVLAGLKAGKIAIRIDAIADVLLKHGTKKSISYPVGWCSVDETSLLLAMMRIVCGKHPSIDSLISMSARSHKLTFAVSLFARNHHYTQIYAKKVHEFTDTSRVYPDNYCYFYLGHYFTRLTADEYGEIIATVPGRCHEEIKCYSELIFSADLTMISDNIRDNAIILNQASPDIKKILDFLLPGPRGLMKYINIADFTRSEAGCKIFLDEYAKDLDFIHECYFAVGLPRLVEVFPAIFNKDKLTAEFRKNRESKLFPRVVDHFIEWLYDDFASQNVDAINKPAKYRGNVRCIADDFIENWISYYACYQQEPFTDGAKIKYIQKYLSDDDCDLSVIFTFLDNITVEKLDNMAMLKKIANDIFESFITDNKQFFHDTYAEQFIRIAEKYGIDVIDFMTRYNTKCLSGFCVRVARYAIDFSVDVSKIIHTDIAKMIPSKITKQVK